MRGKRSLIFFVTAFTVTQLVTSAWAVPQEKVLHNFKNNGKDGYYAIASLMFDGGNLYGTTLQGGIYGVGTVFELTPKASGGWTEKVLHSFSNNGSDGTRPYGGLISDASGNLYGTTYSPLRMITDREHAIGEVDVAPTGVHDFLLPSTRTEKELKRDPLLGHGSAEQQFQIVGMISLHDLLGVLVPDGHVLDPVVTQSKSPESVRTI
jgi:uncharacterized repeat protein (TIGR03803 family)